MGEDSRAAMRRFAFAVGPLCLIRATQCQQETPFGNAQQFSAIRSFKAKLAAKQVPLVGVGVQLTDPTSTDALCDTVDFIWYDQEHTPMSPEMLKWHIIAAHGKGTAAIVRVPGPNRCPTAVWGTWIKHALDSNADGIVVPQVRTAEEVRGIVADCRYPRGGQRSAPYNQSQAGSPDACRRGFGPTTPMNYGRIPMDTYLAAADDSVFVGVMIETTEALENIEDICAVDGLDCVVIGANDLSASMGLPYQGAAPQVQQAIDQIIAVAKRNGKAVFFSTRNVDLAQKLAAKGVEILHVGSDVLAAVAHQSNVVKAIKSQRTKEEK